LPAFREATLGRGGSTEAWGVARVLEDHGGALPAFRAQATGQPRAGAPQGGAITVADLRPEPTVAADRGRMTVSLGSTSLQWPLLLNYVDYEAPGLSSVPGGLHGFFRRGRSGRLAAAGPGRHGQLRAPLTITKEGAAA